MRGTIRTFLGREIDSVLGRPIGRNLAGTFVLKIASVILLFLNSIVMARILGAGDYGVYSFVMAWVSIGSMVALFGLDRLLVREVAAFVAKSEWGLLRGILGWSSRRALLLSIAIIACATPVILFTPIREGTIAPGAYLIGLLFIPAAALTRVLQSAIQGLCRVVPGQIPEFILRPFLLATSLTAIRLLAGPGIGAEPALALNVAAMTAALGVSFALLRRYLPEKVSETKPEYRSADWRRSGRMLLFLSGMHILSSRTDTVMLGILRTPEEVGVYAIAARGAWFAFLALVCANIVLGPAVSTLFAGGEISRLQSLVRRMSRVTFLVSLFVWGFLVMVGGPFLAVFGPEFPGGYRALVILATGLLLCTQAPSGGILLIMTGHEKRAARGATFAVILNVALNGILIPRYGIEGAAAATAVSSLFLNLYAAFYAGKLTGIDATLLLGSVFPRGRRRR